MNNVSKLVIDMLHVNDDGTIELIDVANNWPEYPIRWRYKLYYDFNKNKNRLFESFHFNSNCEFKISKRFYIYLEDRAILFNEVYNNYQPMINSILNSDFSKEGKKAMIEIIDLELNKIYPYSNNHRP